MIGSLTCLILFISIVFIFDPFYIYHKPLPFLKAVLTDKEYQCVGTLKNFEYDSLIVGSSVCENYDNSWFDNAYQCKTIKAVRSYGATADLCYLLNIAYEDHDIKNVFYNIDPSSLSADPVTTYESTGCPIYLYDDMIFNDYKYWLNKDVIFEKIPYMIANSFSSEYHEGNSYNWAQWKFFNSQICTDLYDRPETIVSMYPENKDQINLDKNISLLKEIVSSHPETDFKFFFSPYSMLWWDNSYRTGDRDAVLYNEKKCVEELLSFDNVEIYFYQDDINIITDLENYMDTIHFSKDINRYIFDKLSNKEDQITYENIDQVFQNMLLLSDQINNEYILKYYP